MESRHEQFLLKLGERIRVEREKMEISQRLMASNLNIDERHLRRIEKGNTNPTVLLLIEVSEYLKIELRCLLPSIFDDSE